MIYFNMNLINKAMEYIHDSHEFLEMKQDMEKIEYAKMNIHTVEGIRFAKNWIKSYDRNIRLSI